MSAHRVIRVLTALTAAGLLVTTGFAPKAEAGPYVAMQCSSRAGAGHGGFSFVRNSQHFRRDVRCGSGGALGIVHARKRTHSGRAAKWEARAPDGTYLTSGRLMARGRRDGGLAPRLLLGVPGDGALAPFATPHRHFKTFRWRARAGRLAVQLACVREGGRCASTDVPRIYVKRARFRLFDSVVPSVPGLGGALLGAPVQRETQALAVKARDTGAGVRRVVVRVNGRPFAHAGSNCAINGKVALSLSPCPNAPSRMLALDTTLPAFHDGQNTVETCVEDYARQNPNQRCAKRRIRVQNACPISDMTAPVRASFRFANGRQAKRVGYGRRPKVVARLSDGSGSPGSGALVCVSQRPALTGSTETLVGPPLRTDERGRVSVRLPAGPSRIVYLTYWRGAEDVVTRALRLRVRPRVGLRVRPRRKLRNGETMRLRATLRGPFRAHREVRFLARPPGGRWVPLSADFEKRTSARGIARASHTFRHVSGRHKFRFKVKVPRQTGYPYLRAHSRVRKKTATS